MRTKFTSVLLALLIGVGAAHANEGGHAAGWQRQAGNEVANLPSLQRGARNFMAYCSACHSLRFVRYSRVAEDLKIPLGTVKSRLHAAVATFAKHWKARVEESGGHTA